MAANVRSCSATMASVRWKSWADSAQMRLTICSSCVLFNLLPTTYFLPLFLSAQIKTKPWKSRRGRSRAWCKHADQEGNGAGGESAECQMREDLNKKG
jgi:hypothetical protein